MSDQVKAELAAILQRRAEQAGQSAYDRAVLIGAVAAARDVVEAVPQAGGAAAYLGRVRDALSALFETYNDTSGEFTNGRAAIGDIRLDVTRLLEALGAADGT